MKDDGHTIYLTRAEWAEIERRMELGHRFDRLIEGFHPLASPREFVIDDERAA